ncbi:MAG: peptide chain release factor N(5)-glutamine methyltransferase [Spirochaetaceae bacterium]|jgi:release factor glutamine methyltransferase|nr:peptide chain release factor N(5)-glutamine methyltransferase [Spirochaetaceae bacterium]
MTAGEAVLSAKTQFQRAGMETPALDAQLLLASLLSKTRSELITHSQLQLCDETLHLYEESVEKRLRGLPVAYITGVKAFRSLELAVTPDVLVPRPDTETLVEAALCRLNKNSASSRAVLDLCTGSGAVGLALWEECGLSALTMQDISREALAVARGNFGFLRKNSRREAPEAVFIAGDLFEGVSGVFDVITANPPYIPSADIAALAKEVRSEPRLALDGGEDGLFVIRRIASGCAARLSCGGALFLEASPEQMPSIRALFEREGFSKIGCHKDLAGRERVIEAAF